MTGTCDICDQVREVFQPAGQRDLICSDCYVSIGTAIQLYETLTEVERAGHSAIELETQIKHILGRLFNRFESRANHGERSARLPSTKLRIH